VPTCATRNATRHRSTVRPDRAKLLDRGRRNRQAHDLVTTAKAPATRPVRADDADAVLRMQHAHQLAVLGRPDATLDDIQEQLDDPDLDPASTVVVTGDGTVLGCAMVFHDGDSGRADVDVVVDPGPGAGFARPLLDHAVDLCVEHGRRIGAAEVLVDQGCYRDDAAFAAVLREAGFETATSFHRMRRPLDGPIEVARPGGVEIERVDVESDEALRRAHTLHMSTFAGHFGFVPRSYGEWLAAHRSRSVGTGPLWFARLDGQDAGFLSETDQFLEDEQSGYVQRLGVERAARGRGVARALLLSSFAHMLERGRVAALLHVDTANHTGATRLYESVGMTPVVVIDAWRLTRPVR
jgi:GNAT superfamily N-acetyltransferase